MANQEARIDKWLWAARIYKTRTLAADACKNGRITINGAQTKPSRTVKAGDKVEKNQVVAIVEAMKMEIPVVAPQDGTVASIDVAVGDAVEAGALLATLK